MKKSDLRTGMFGIFDDETDVFVIVDDKFIYQNGCKDELASLNDNLEMPSGRKIMKLYDASCFKAVEHGDAKLIWERTDETPVTPEDGAITITEDQFFEAVKKATEEWDKANDEVEGGELLGMLMGMHNMTFAAMLATILFDKNDADEE